MIEGSAWSLSLIDYQAITREQILPGSDLGITQCHSYPICRYKHVSSPKKIVLRYDRRKWKIDRGCVKYRETSYLEFSVKQFAGLKYNVAIDLWTFGGADATVACLHLVRLGSCKNVLFYFPIVPLVPMDHWNCPNSQKNRFWGKRTTIYHR